MGAYGRLGVGVSGGALVFGPMFALASALGVAEMSAVLVAVAIAGLTGVLVTRRAPPVFDRLWQKRPVPFALACLLIVIGAANMARVSRYMADSTRVAWATWPDDDFFVHHNCLTAYDRAAEVSRENAPNLYEEVHYWGAPDDPNDPRANIAGFPVDLYEYPPPFLVPMRGVVALTSDFLTIRALWFALEALVLLAGLLLLARWIGGNEGAIVALASPAVLLALPTLEVLQVGNYQLAVFALTIMALVAFESRWTRTGALLLAFSTLTKVFPGIFFVYLAAQRRWRDLAYTLAFSAALLVLTFVVVGVDPFRAFVTYQLPRMADGRAFPFLEMFPPATAANHSIFGIVLKLRLLGWSSMTMGVAGVVAWIYSFVLVGVTAVLARQSRTRRQQAILWVAILQLAVLRSPFTPDIYAVLGPLWLLALWAPNAGLRRGIALAAGWLGLNAAVMLLSVTRPMSIELRLVLTGLGQLLGLAVTIVSLRRARPHGDDACDALADGARRGVSGDEAGDLRRKGQ